MIVTIDVFPAYLARRAKPTSARRAGPTWSKGPGLRGAACRARPTWSKGPGLLGPKGQAYLGLRAKSERLLSNDQQLGDTPSLSPDSSLFFTQPVSRSVKGHSIIEPKLFKENTLDFDIFAFSSTSHLASRHQRRTIFTSRVVWA